MKSFREQGTTKDNGLRLSPDTADLHHVEAGKTMRPTGMPTPVICMEPATPRNSDPRTPLP